MSGGALREPVVLNGEETTEVDNNVIVLRGGHLQAPYILTDMYSEDGKLFFPLKKWNKGLCFSSQACRHSVTR